MEITIPSRFMGDVSGNINSRRGRIIGMESQGDMQVVRAEMPLAEVMNYSTELRSLTGGIGSYTMEFNRYEVLPPRFQSQIVEQLKRDQKEKEEEE
jgi:elongation factor G